MKNEKKEEELPEKPYCFVMMPISDAVGYAPGHFKRVYEYIIKPACVEAGFNPVRADDIKGTNVIVIDILRRIIQSEMALCDLSAKNPNVLYELGIRQSFDLPVTFIKDDITDRIFDIQGFRDIPYTSNLRVDEVNNAIDAIALSLQETYNNKGKDINSIIELLGISKAVLPEPISLSKEGEVLLDALNDIREKLSSVTTIKTKIDAVALAPSPIYNPNFDDDPSLEPVNLNTLKVGDVIEHNRFGTGRIKQLDIKGTEKKATIDFTLVGTKTLLISFSKLKRKRDPTNNSAKEN